MPRRSSGTAVSIMNAGPQCFAQACSRLWHRLGRRSHHALVIWIRGASSPAIDASMCFMTKSCMHALQMSMHLMPNRLHARTANVNASHAQKLHALHVSMHLMPNSSKHALHMPLRLQHICLHLGCASIFHDQPPCTRHKKLWLTHPCIQHARTANIDVPHA